MNRFLKVYFVFCCLTLIEIIMYMIYIQITTVTINNLGVKLPAVALYSFTGFYFGHFISFTAFSYAFLAKNHVAMLLYFYYSFFLVLFPTLALPYVVNSYLILGFLLPLIFEIFYVLKNFYIFAGKIIYQRNRKLGSNLRLREALNIRSMTIVSRIVAYFYIFRMFFANIVAGSVYKNQSHRNNYILCPLIGADLFCAFYEKREIKILKIISCLSVFCIWVLIAVVLITKWKYMRKFDRVIILQDLLRVLIYFLFNLYDYLYLNSGLKEYYRDI